MSLLLRQYPRNTRSHATGVPSQGTELFGLIDAISGYQEVPYNVIYQIDFFEYTPTFVKATVRAADVLATQTNFPAYVNLTRLGITGLAQAQSVRVYSDVGKTTELAREIVSASEMHVTAIPLRRRLPGA